MSPVIEQTNRSAISPIILVPMVRRKSADTFKCFWSSLIHSVLCKFS